MGIGLFLGMFVAPLFGQETTAAGYRFACEDDGFGLSAVDVLRASGDHDAFLELLGRHDLEGYAVLADAGLADKTVWAPTDAAFLAAADALSSLSDEQIGVILGYHISPPRRAPGGSYPVVTPQLLISAKRMIHRTRTGVLTKSDQRTRTSVTDGVLLIEDAQIMETAWCTQAGSVFSLDAVIMNVATPATLVRIMNRIIRILFYDDIRFVLYSTAGATLIGLLVGRAASRRIERRKRARAT